MLKKELRCRTPGHAEHRQRYRLVRPVIAKACGQSHGLAWHWMLPEEGMALWLKPWLVMAEACGQMHGPDHGHVKLPKENVTVGQVFSASFTSKAQHILRLPYGGTTGVAKVV